MSKDECCENCRFWRGKIVGRTYTAGPCKRFPPASHGAGAHNQYRPIMGIGDWCGEFEARATTTGEAK